MVGILRLSTNRPGVGSQHAAARTNGRPTAGTLGIGPRDHLHASKDTHRELNPLLAAPKSPETQARVSLRKERV